MNNNDFDKMFNVVLGLTCVNVILGVIVVCVALNILWNKAADLIVV